MARMLNRLSARTVATLKQPGRHSDGGGLYLSISSDGRRRRWVFLFRWRPPGVPTPGKFQEMGLGSAATVSLGQARDLAAKARQHLANGLNPLELKRTVRRIPTFGEVADEVIASLASAWRNPKHRAQ